MPDNKKSGKGVKQGTVRGAYPRVARRNSKKKKTFLAALDLSAGNISAACRKAGVSRFTYYGWIDEDEAFARAVHEIEEAEIDFTETALKQQIREGNITAIIFYLKTRGKERGYVERTEINDISGEVDVQIGD
jgi:hypothetical protein